VPVLRNTAEHMNYRWDAFKACGVTRYPLLPLLLFAALSGACRKEPEQAGGIETTNLASRLLPVKCILPELTFSFL